LNATRGIAVLEPDGALSRDDFERAAKAIDPHLQNSAYFVGADIRPFKFAEFARARAWAAGES